MCHEGSKGGLLLIEIERSQQILCFDNHVSVTCSLGRRRLEIDDQFPLKYNVKRERLAGALSYDHAIEMFA